MMAFYSDSDPAPRCHTFSLSFPDTFLLLYIQIGVTPQCPKPPSLARLSPLVSVSTFIALNPTRLPMTSQV